MSDIGTGFGEDIESGILSEFSNSKRLLVTFGGVSQGLGIPVFEFFKSISHIDCDKLFIRDLGQSWYQEGIDDEITSLIELRTYLKTLISEKGYENIVFMGNSMGGFAAIFFGSVLNVSRIISFAPQTFIGKFKRVFYLDFRWKSQIKKIHQNKSLDKTTFDLKNVLKTLNSKLPQIDVYYSTSHRLDKLHAERLKSIKSIKLHGYKDGGHSLVKKLRDDGSLIVLINNIFD